jgi:hypothetical protein
MQYFLLGVVGLSLNDINELTLNDATQIIDIYNKNKLDDNKTLEVILYNAVGQTLSGKGNFKSIFSDRVSTKKIKTKEQLNKEATQLVNYFGGE